MVAPSSLQLFSNLARPSRSRYSVTSSKSMPTAASWSSTWRLAAYSPVTVSPETWPWSAKASRVAPGIVLTVPAAMSPATYLVSG
jgi:hypothetical protein